SSIFFFQAEDGIRDPLVTGVQTCALPISRSRYARPLRIVLSQPLSRYGCRFTPHPRSVMSLLAVGDVSIRRTGRGGGGDRSAREIGRASCRERGRVGGGRGSSNSK